MYAHEEVEKWVLGIPFEESGRPRARNVRRPFSNALGKKHFIIETDAVKPQGDQPERGFFRRAV